MGGTQSSEALVSTQETVNAINSISNENCINSCTSQINDVVLDISYSDLSGINIGAICNILGASCVLKASLSNQLTNKNIANQKGESMQEIDPLMLGQMSSATVNETTSQVISNRVTNILNSTCQQIDTNNISDIDIELTHDVVTGVINLESQGKIEKTSCILNNVSRNIISNENDTEQSAKIMQGSPLLYLIMAAVVIGCLVVGVILILGLAKVASNYESKKKMPPGSRPMPPGSIPMPVRRGPPPYRK